MKTQRQERGARWSHPRHQGRAGTHRLRYRRREASEAAWLGDEHVRASLGSQMVKSQPATQEMWAQSLGREDPLKEGMVTTAILVPGRFHGQRSLVGYGPRGHKEPDTTDQLPLSHQGRWRGADQQGGRTKKAGAGFVFIFSTLAKG